MIYMTLVCCICQRRNAYRKTLSTIRQVSDYRLKTVFIMGNYDSVPYDKSPIYTESAIYGDILVGDFVDHYFNNTYKYLHSLKLARWYCISTSSVSPFVVLMDDDYMLNLANLISVINKHPPNEQLYMGFRFDTSPFRLFFRKFRVCGIILTFFITFLGFSR